MNINVNYRGQLPEAEHAQCRSAHHPMRTRCKGHSALKGFAAWTSSSGSRLGSIWYGSKGGGKFLYSTSPELWQWCGVKHVGASQNARRCKTTQLTSLKCTSKDL